MSLYCKPVSIAIIAVLFALLLFSCAPEIEPIPEYPSSSGASSSNVAVLGSSSSLLSSGSNVSVISSSSRVSSSSVAITSSSSSVKLSSGTYCLDYDWQECILSNGNPCPDWSTPSNSCPNGWYIYNLSSSSSKPSSSSTPPPSSSSAVTGTGLCAGFVNGTKREHYGKEKAQFCDERDGKKYVYVTIGEQTWMAENLNYEANGSKCYNNSEANCTIYGRLYNWTMAMSVCPSNWHLPSTIEWDRLMRKVDGNTGTSDPYDSQIAGRYLKATSGWETVNGTDDHGFTALPGGENSSGSFINLGVFGDWWDKFEKDTENAYGRGMHNNDVARLLILNKSDFFSVRCLKD